MCQIFPSTIYLYGNCNWLISNFIKFISENVLCLNILYMYACCTLYWTTMIILWETKYILEFDYRIETRLKSCVTKIYELLLRKNKWGCFVVWTLVGWVRVRRSKRAHTCVVMWGMGRGVLGVVMKDSIMHCSRYLPWIWWSVTIWSVVLTYLFTWYLLSTVLTCWGQSAQPMQTNPPSL